MCFYLMSVTGQENGTDILQPHRDRWSVSEGLLLYQTGYCSCFSQTLRKASDASPT